MFKFFKALPRLKAESGALVMRIEEPNGALHDVEFTEGCVTLEVALASGIEISHSCGGMGTCGTCRIEVIEGAYLAEEPNEIESETARDKAFGKNERLACQMTAKNGFKVRIL